jgi:putative colanic acid biosysnthesis UDP-glucose lipid carrier transferase
MLHAPLSDTESRLTTPQAGSAFLHWLAKSLDTGVIALALLIPTYIRSEAWPLRYTVGLLLAIITFHALSGMLNLYRPWRGESITRQFARVLVVWTLTVFALLFTAYVVKETASFSRLAVTTWFVAAPLTMLAWRAGARLVLIRLVAKETIRRSALILGTGETADQLAQKIQDTATTGLTLVDIVPVPGEEPEAGEAKMDQVPEHQSQTLVPLTPAEQIELRARRGEFSVLYIILGSVPRATAADVVERLSDTTVSVYMVPDFFETHLFHGQWSSLGGIPIVSIFDTPFWGADGWLKKVQDLLLGTLILTLAAVPMLLIALSVKLTSKGPILFRQRRYGVDGKEIAVLKFRTMTVTQDGDNVPQATKNDKRFTPIGGFLRRHSLDELPQFINVIRGEMSIVGPRPHAIAHNELYRKKVKGYMLRHKVKPGITGWAQINGWRGETDDLYKMEKRVEHDLWYIRNWSFWLDIKIIFISIFRGFSSPQAY